MKDSNISTETPKSPKYIAVVTPADGDCFTEALAIAIAQGAVAPDAPQPAALGLANGAWEVQS